MDDHTPDCTAHGASYSALTFSFLAGGIAGATVALLLAPQSGKVTREIMGRKLNDAADSARELKASQRCRRGHEIHAARPRPRVEGAASALAGKPRKKPVRTGTSRTPISLGLEGQRARKK